MWAARRRTEIGIRLALGAPARAVHRVVLSGVSELVAVGAVIGVVCAIGVVQVERGIFGPILSLGVIPLGASIAALGLVGGLAAIIPSLRAARQAPADVLRSS